MIYPQIANTIGQTPIRHFRVGSMPERHQHRPEGPRSLDPISKSIDKT